MKLISFRGKWNLYACKASDYKILWLYNKFKSIHDLNEKTPLERVWTLELELGRTLLDLTALKPWTSELIFSELSFHISKMRMIKATSWERREHEKQCYKT